MHHRTMMHIRADSNAHKCRRSSQTLCAQVRSKDELTMSKKEHTPLMLSNRWYANRSKKECETLWGNDMHKQYGGTWCGHCGENDAQRLYEMCGGGKLVRGERRIKQNGARWHGMVCGTAAPASAMQVVAVPCARGFSTREKLGCLVRGVVDRKQRIVTANFVFATRNSHGGGVHTPPLTPVRLYREHVQRTQRDVWQRERGRNESVEGVCCGRSLNHTVYNHYEPHARAQVSSTGKFQVGTS